MTTQQINLRVTTKIAKSLKEKADKLDISLNQYISFILIKEVQSFYFTNEVIKGQ